MEKLKRVGNRILENNLFGILLGGAITLTLLFIGPLRTMATHNDLTNLRRELKREISKNTYAEDRKLLMAYVKKLDPISKQMEDLGKEITALQVEIKYLRKELPNPR